jgi:hypothetical protein
MYGVGLAAVWPRFPVVKIGGIASDDFDRVVCAAPVHNDVLQIRVILLEH